MALQGFHETRFPTDISYKSTGGPMFKTQVFEAYQGREKRNMEWSQPLMKFNVAYGVKTDTQMQALISFFNARQGKAYGFRFKNPLDYTVTAAVVAVGDGAKTTLPLTKHYGFSTGEEHYKRLYKIVKGSVSGVGIGAAGTLVEGVDYYIDYVNGEIAFNTAIAFGIPVFATLEFDEPVRFDVDNIQALIDAFNSNSLNKLPLVSVRPEEITTQVQGPTKSSSALDSFYDQTNLILDFNDVAVLTTTVDHSRLGLPVVINGNSTLTKTGFYGGGGAFSVGTGSLNVTSPDAFNLTTSAEPFTIEAFIQRPVAGSTVQEHVIGVWNETTNQRSWALRYIPQNNELQFIVSTDGTTESIVLRSFWGVAIGEYSYVSIDRIVNGWYVMRIGGKVVANTRLNTNLHVTTDNLFVGQIPSPTASQGPYRGLIDSIRITVGQPRHVGFTEVPIPNYYPY